jgi:hypothetical protein
MLLKSTPVIDKKGRAGDRTVREVHQQARLLTKVNVKVPVKILTLFSG